MNIPTAIVMSALVIGAAIAVPAVVQIQQQPGTFQMVKAGDTTVWVLETASGWLQVCHASRNPQGHFGIECLPNGDNPFDRFTMPGAAGLQRK